MRKPTLHILWFPQKLVVLGALLVGLLLMWSSAALPTTAWSVALGEAGRRTFEPSTMDPTLDPIKSPATLNPPSHRTLPETLCINPDALGLGLPLLHASLRSPNLKSRLSSAREEFRAVW